LHPTSLLSSAYAYGIAGIDRRDPASGCRRNQNVSSLCSIWSLSCQKYGIPCQQTIADWRLTGYLARITGRPGDPSKVLGDSQDCHHNTGQDQ
jgi:hypothetical protein